MSARKTPLKHPAVVIGVLCGLVAVGALNLQTFGPRLGLFGDRTAQPADPLIPPPDLEAVVQDAVQDAGRRPVATAGGSGWPAIARDPFASGAPAPPAPAAAVRKQPDRKPDPLVCSAVLLGGARPLALIDGESHGPGDSVRGLEILTIDADGVRLRKPDGSELVLAVGPPRDEPSAYHLVTETRSAADAGQTSLAGSRSTERTER